MPPSVSRPFTRKSSTLPTKPVKKKKWVDRHSQLKSSPLLQPLMSGSAAGGEGAFQTPGGPGANMSSPVSPARLWATLQALRPGAPPSTGTLGGTGGGGQSVKPLHPGAREGGQAESLGWAGRQLSGPEPAGSGASSPSTRVKVSLKRFCWPAA